MIDGHKVLAIIPARGGSKGVPHKNIKMVNGRPLIAYSILQAKKSKYIDTVIVSSDDQEIMEIASSWGADVPFKRPSELSLDDTPGIAPVIHAIQHIPGYDIAVLLQPTSPLRNSEDIDYCIRETIHTGYPCVSVTSVDKSPYWMYTVNNRGSLERLIDSDTVISRRQDAPPVYVLNGAVYVAPSNWLLETGSFVSEHTVAYVMPPERSIDLDTENDFLYLEFILQNQLEEENENDKV